jgi:hypothetical protein
MGVVRPHEDRVQGVRHLEVADITPAPDQEPWIFPAPQGRANTVRFHMSLQVGRRQHNRDKPAGNGVERTLGVACVTLVRPAWR